MLARVLSAALSRDSAGQRDGGCQWIEALPVEGEVNSGWGDTVSVQIMSISPINQLRSSD